MVAARIEPVDLRMMPEEVAAPLAELLRVLATERVPEDPPTSREVLVTRLRTLTPAQENRSFVARAPSGEIVGFARADRYLMGQNEHECEADVRVIPGWRRRGTGRALLQRLVDHWSGVAGALVIGYTSDRVPSGAAFAERIGATRGIAAHTNQLDLATVDRDLVARWRALERELATEYEIVFFAGATPDRYVAPLVQALEAMNSAPRGDLEVGDFHWTPEVLRDREEWIRKAGVEVWSVLAVHRASGEGAGFTLTGYDPLVSHVVGQYGTGVLPAHRGKGLGKLVKAIMLERVLAERTLARYIRTGNADANAAMLAINTKLGFKPAWANTVWQAKVPALRRYLEGSRAQVSATAT